MRFKDDAEVEEFVRRFDSCELPLAEFSHAAHVAVAAAFVHEDAGGAMDRMRTGLLRITEHNGKTGVYKEDITQKWIAVIREFVAERSGESLVEVVNAAVEELAPCHNR
jgi:hypothetical protein